VPHQERIAGLELANKALGDELAKVKAQPVHGGPVLSAAARIAPKADGEDHAAKAAYYERVADQVSPDLAVHYRQLASDEKAKITP
jgi:hypothetical protein